MFEQDAEVWVRTKVYRVEEDGTIVIDQPFRHQKPEDIRLSPPPETASPPPGLQKLVMDIKDWDLPDNLFADSIIMEQQWGIEAGNSIRQAVDVLREIVRICDEHG